MMKIFLALVCGAAITGLAIELWRHKDETKNRFRIVADEFTDLEMTFEDKNKALLEDLTNSLTANKNQKGQKEGYV